MTTPVPALLAAALGAGVLAACTGDDTPPTGQSASPARDDPDTAALRAALAREMSLLAAYDDPLAATAGLSVAADEARVHHLLHVRAIEALLGPAPAPGSAATPSVGTAGSAAATPSAPPPTVAPSTDAVGLARVLLAAERAAADAGIAAVGDGIAAATSRLLAEIAASEAQHATALYIGLREGTIRRRPQPLPSAS